MGLRPRLPIRNRTPRHLHWLAPHLQSPPRPHRTRRPTTSHPRSQPLRSVQLGHDRPMTYPVWTYYPSNVRPPQWVANIVNAVAANEETISTEVRKTDLSSDAVLAALRPGLRSLGYAVESGKAVADKIRRPVLFGENGSAEVSYEID